jgi:uncharacterized protein YjgD (DUF1641 family)
MSEKPTQEQINEINRKLDQILEEISVQRQNREAVNDLLDDVAVIGKDAFKEMVIQLDNAQIELDGDTLRCLLMRFVRNVGNIGVLLETLESINDLSKDITPIIKQVGLDGIQKFHQLEQKGYFEILNQLLLTIDAIVSRYSKEELQNLSNNLIPVAETLMSVADPKLLNKVNSALTAIKSINMEEVEEYSVWKLIRELNKPEIKKSFGFIITLIKSIMNQEKQIIKEINN